MLVNRWGAGHHQSSACYTLRDTTPRLAYDDPSCCQMCVGLQRSVECQGLSQMGCDTVSQPQSCLILRRHHVFCTHLYYEMTQIRTKKSNHNASGRYEEHSHSRLGRESSTALCLASSCDCSSTLVKSENVRRDSYHNTAELVE